MTNDERKSKTECRRALRRGKARSSFRFRYSFVFLHSPFGFEDRGSWKVCWLLPSLAPTGPVDPPEFGLDVVALIKRQPAAQASGFSRRAIGELRIGMKAGHRRIGPDPMTRLPG